MVKKKISKSKKRQSLIRKHRVLVTLLIATCLLLMFGLIKGVSYQIETRHERSQYDHARANLNALYDEIVAAAGKPDQTKDDARCGYVSQEFSDGPRYCDVYKYFVYRKVTKEQAIKINNEISGVITHSKSVKFERIILSSDDYVERSNLKSVVFTAAGLKQCGTDSVYITRETTDDYSSIANGGFIKGPGLSYMLTCSGGALKEYFPVRN